MVSFLKDQNIYNGEIDKFISQRYRVIARLSKGGTSEIFKAIDKFNNSKVAIKILLTEYVDDPEEVIDNKDGIIPGSPNHEIAKAHEFITQEVKFLESCHHPNIIHLRDYNLTAERPYIVLDFLENITLEKEILHKNRTFSIKETLSILEQICDVLGYVHNKGYVYCDLKPNNIISINQNLILIDFGLIRPINTPILGGTIGYMAPEALQSYNNPVLAEPTLDIYSLGILLYELLTEFHPTAYQNNINVANHSEGKNISTKATPNPKLASELNPYLPKVFDKILLHCIENNPKDRYQITDHLIRDFTKEAKSFI
ncbi:MAG: serine/threonine-protein kinase [Chloroflexi bacterium]|nr:serine/threonine-protein kinase [Chloroflexota bacterium]